MKKYEKKVKDDESKFINTLYECYCRDLENMKNLTYIRLAIEIPISQLQSIYDSIKIKYEYYTFWTLKHIMKEIRLKEVFKDLSF